MSMWDDGRNKARSKDGRWSIDPNSLGGFMLRDSILKSAQSFQTIKQAKEYAEEQEVLLNPEKLIGAADHATGQATVRQRDRIEGDRHEAGRKGSGTEMRGGESVQGTRGQDLLDCPICGVKVKAKNLLRHNDKQHKGPDVPSSAGPRTAPKSRARAESAPKRAPLITSSGVAECGELLELASVDLYRTNLFRVIGLSVEASGADVRRRQARIEMQRKLGLNGASTQQSPFPLFPPPHAEVEREAMQRLADPQARLFDEIFWFWPVNGDIASDQAWQALQAGRLEAAANIWTRQQALDPGGIASHNLAVLSHLRALDAEVEAQGADAQERWVEAFRRWGEVIQGESFWTAVRGRISALDDQKLTTGLVRRIRGAFPKMLLLINMRIAIAAAEGGDTETARRHVGLVGDAGYGDDVVREVRGDALRPLRRRLNSAIETATSRWGAKPHRGCEYVREFQKQAESLLGIVDSLVPPGDRVRTSLHDSVANTMLRGQVAYGNKTNDYETSIQLLRSAKGIVEGAATHAKLDEQLNVLGELNNSGNDWCSPGYWDFPQETIDALEAARSSADAGDLDGAIHALAKLQTQGCGRPLRRCLSYCLSLEGIRISNAAQDAYDPDTAVITKILEKIQAGDYSVRRGLLRPPTPDMHVTPPCLHCESTDYTSWVNFKYRDVPLYMCSSCSARQDAELEREKRQLRAELRKASEYLLLADEIDPKEKGVLRDLKIIERMAADFDVKIPRIWRLKKKYGLNLRALRSSPSSGPVARSRTSVWPATAVGATFGTLAFVVTHFIALADGRKSSRILYDWVASVAGVAGGFEIGGSAEWLVWNSLALLFIAGGALIGALAGVLRRKSPQQPSTPVNHASSRRNTAATLSSRVSDGEPPKPPRSKGADRPERTKLPRVAPASFAEFLGCDGQSTRDDVLRLFGTPASTDTDEEDGSTNYRFGDGHTLWVSVDKEGRIGLVSIKTGGREFVRRRGLDHPALDLLGKPRSDVEATVGKPRSDSSGFLRYISPDGAFLVNLICFQHDDDICSEIWVQWHR